MPSSLDGLKKPRNYEVGDTHARGGMGAILCAKDLNISRTVAMKVLLSERADAAANLMRFVDEAKITGQLEHPNIVPVHELGVDEQGRLFYTMKFVMGVTLKQVLEEIKQGKPETIARYSLAQLLTVFQKICDAVAFAHARSIVHRDLKPENIMLGEYGEVLVMDWGLAKVLKIDKTQPYEGPTLLDADDVASARLDAADVYRTVAGTVMGSPNFMPPEQAEGRIDQIDARTDIFALGGLLYNILTLQPPITGNTVPELLEKARTAQITPPSGGPRSVVAASFPHLPHGKVPDSLSAVAMKALSKAPEDRYQSVKELQQDIEAYQNGFATAAEHASIFKQIWLLIKRHKTVSIATAIIVLLSAGFTAKVIAEGRRAESALARLRETAPTFYAQAKSLLDAGKFDDALTKIGYAIDLVTDNADYRLFRANLLEATQRLADAAEEYQRALALRPTDVSAQKNLALCERLLAENAGATTLRPSLQRQLLDSMLAENRGVEAVPLAQILGRDADIAEAMILARLKEYTSQAGWKDYLRLRPQTNGMFYLILSELVLGDLEQLKGLPIDRLILNNTTLTDLSPLSHLPLNTLSLMKTKVTDLSPLRGMQLHHLDCRLTEVTNLTPLAGMPLETLFITECAVSDLSPLRNMSLRNLDIGGTKVTDLRPLSGLPLEEFSDRSGLVSDLTPLRGLPLKVMSLQNSKVRINVGPLAECRALEEILLPPQPVNVSALKGLPKLQRIEWCGLGYPSADKFWEKFGAAFSAMDTVHTALRTLGIPAKNINSTVDVSTNGLLDVNLNGLPISEISFLTGLPIAKLSLRETNVSDLSPLHGIPLQHLELFGCPISDLSTVIENPVLRLLGIGGTQVTDLRPLSKLKLTTIYLNNTPIRDVSPLAACKTLEQILLRRDVSGVESLRKLPHLKRISYEHRRGKVAQTAEEFWKEYDAAKAKARK